MVYTLAAMDHSSIFSADDDEAARVVDEAREVSAFL